LLFLLHILCAVGVHLVFQPGAFAAANVPEVRGASIPAAADAISKPATTEATMKRLREIGLNTVYVECYRDGVTEYPSDTLKRTIGVDRNPTLMKNNPSHEGRDLLVETLIEAHRSSLVYIAMFGPPVAPKGTIEMTGHVPQDWLAIDKNGKVIMHDGQHPCLNPVHPAVNDFLRSLVVDAVMKYDLDGVQLDVRWPSIEAGYDAYTKGLYSKEHGGHEPPSDASDNEWKAWRAGKLTEQAATLASAVRNARPGLIVSVLVAPYPTCIDRDLCAWSDWSSASERFGWSEFVMRLGSSAPSAEKDWLEQFNRAGAPRVDLLACLETDLPQPTWSEIKLWIDASRAIRATEADPARKGAGHVLPISTIDAFSKELGEFYKHDGAMIPSHPHFATRTPGDWRPAPSPPVPTGLKAPRDTEKWDIPTVLPAEYDIIAKENGVRRIVMHLNLVQSHPVLVIPTRYTEPELILDRRPDLAAK